jgi:DNA-binding transcriptional ArsR family regulator
MSAPFPTAADTTAPDLDQVDVATLLHALSDPVRLAIVQQIDAEGPGGEVSCGQLNVPVGKSTCTHHLKNLIASGVTAERQEGTRKYIRLRRDELDQRFPGLMDSVLRAAASGN